MRKKIGISSTVLFLAVLGLIGFSASPTMAVQEFKDAFQAKYIKSDSGKANDGALAQAFGPGQPPGDQPRGPRPDWPSMERNDPEVNRLINAANELDRRTRDVAKTYREAPKEQRAKLKEDLKKLVTEQFETWQQRRKLELTRLEEELKRLRDATESRQKKKLQVIDNRVSDLLGEEAEPGF